MARKTIGHVMYDILDENESWIVMWGDCGFLDECASRANVKCKIPHPYNRWQRVLNGLDRSPLFEKRYVKVEDGNWGGWVRSFRCAELEAIHNKREGK